MISDTWDSGNRMTRFEEITEICKYCNGEGVIKKDCNDEHGFFYIEEDCEECGGEGTITYER